MLGWDLWWYPLVAFVAAFFAGVANAVAGGGSNITFPTLLWLGFPPIGANVTNGTGLWTGIAGSVFGFRREIRELRRWWLWLAIPSVLGGAAGAFLLLNLPASSFEKAAPYLVIGSTILVALEPRIRKRLAVGDASRRGKRWRGFAIVLQFVLCVYGGYFGAGLGIMMLSTLALLGVGDLAHVNGLKNLLAAAMKAVAIGFYIVAGEILWYAVPVLALGSFLGGLAGARLGRRVEERRLRLGVVVFGLIMGLTLFLRQ